MDVLKTAIAILLAITTGAAAARAADKPNFSGEWTMNVTRSNFGALPPPNSILRSITHTDPSITIVEDQDSPMGLQKSTRSYTTDGRDVTFQVNGTDVKGSAAWDGDTLVVISNVESAGVRFVDRMSLSDGGRTMTSRVQVTSPQGEVALTIVFEKQ